MDKNQFIKILIPPGMVRMNYVKNGLGRGIGRLDGYEVMLGYHVGIVDLERHDSHDMNESVLGSYLGEDVCFAYQKVSDNGILRYRNEFDFLDTRRDFENFNSYKDYLEINGLPDYQVKLHEKDGDYSKSRWISLEEFGNLVNKRAQEIQNMSEQEIRNSDYGYYAHLSDKQRKLIYVIEKYFDRNTGFWMI